MAFFKSYINLAFLVVIGLLVTSVFTYRYLLESTKEDLRLEKKENQRLEDKLKEASFTTKENEKQLQKMEDERKKDFKMIEIMKKDNDFLRDRREKLLAVINMETNETTLKLRQKDILWIKTMYPKANR